MRFALPYRFRFGLSFVCALMVALLYGADIAAVYPLLKILFYNDNCQTWVAKEIVLQETEVRKVDARLAEIDFAAKLDEPAGQALKNHFTAVHKRWDDLSQEYHRLESQVENPALLGQRGKAQGRDQAQLDSFRRELQVAEAGLDELKIYCERQVKTPGAPTDDGRRRQLEKEQAKGTLWLTRYRWLQPRFNQYLPHKGFQTLVILLVLVLAGVALKGFFMFLQEVLVADVMQLSLFDIRNHFFRRTMALDLSSFGDQGTSELISRFTNDMESVGQGLNTLFS
ncbi:MAG: ABC transporter ATP-binding protein, partial [Planctomycetia bacterium]|nr:ABC transporter ATP-binding protein [Planctomycetia bacterium]